MKIAIIGAGIAGLTLARHLNPKYEITIFEKSKGLGGRMATRYDDEYEFDHGAQYFTARSQEFKDFLKPYIEKNIVTAWHPKVTTLEQGKKPYKRDWFEPHYVATPRMTSLCKEMAQNLSIQKATEIKKLTSSDDKKWQIIDHEDQLHGPFDWVISSAPAQQTQELYSTEFDGYASILNTSMEGCFTLMLGFQEQLPIHWQAAVVKSSLIGWISINSSKAMRDKGYSMVVQSTNDWAEDNLETNRDDVQQIMRKELSNILNMELKPNHIALQKWRYAKASNVTDADTDFLIDTNLNLAACGDWCIGGRVEAGFLSAYRLAQHMNTLS